MDDLTRCLYEFVCEKRLGSLAADQEYQKLLDEIARRRERVEASLDQKQRRELRRLIDDVASQGGIEGAHLFQAALSLHRELLGTAFGGISP